MPQTYNWEYCYSDRDHDFYVGARWLCPFGSIVFRGDELHVKMLPTYGVYECLAGPDGADCDSCLRLWDRDQDGDVDLWDVADWSNNQ